MGEEKNFPSLGTVEFFFQAGEAYNLRLKYCDTFGNEKLTDIHWTLDERNAVGHIYSANRKYVISFSFVYSKLGDSYNIYL